MTIIIEHSFDWWTPVIAASAALVGAAIGVAGGVLLEHQRDTRHGRMVISSVSLELAMLSAALKELVIDGTRKREALRNNFWDRYAPDLVNYLPQHLLKAVYMLYLDEFEVVRKAYDFACAGKVPPTERPALGATLLGWAFKAERLVRLVDDHRHSQRKWLNVNHVRPGEKDEHFLRVIDDVTSYAEQHLKELGYRTDMQVRVREEADGSLSFGPAGIVDLAPPTPPSPTAAQADS